jgi:hypothetical protein
MSDLDRALSWLADHPHLAAKAVVLSAEIDHLCLLAEHGSTVQVEAQAARVKAAGFPEAQGLLPVPGRSVMVDAVAISGRSGTRQGVPAIRAVAGSPSTPAVVRGAAGTDLPRPG